MSTPKFAIVLQNSAGTAQTGSTVELCNSSGASYSPQVFFTEIGTTGVYTIDVSTDVTVTNTYTVKIDGSIHDAFNGIIIVSQDIIDHIDDTDIHFEVAAVGNTTSTTQPITAKDVSDRLALKADQTDLDAVESDLATLEADVDLKASATAGTGMVAETGLKLGVNYSSQLKINTSGELDLNVSLASPQVLTQSANLNSLLQNIDNYLKNITNAGVAATNQARNLYSSTEVATSPTTTPIAPTPITIPKVSGSWMHALKLFTLKLPSDVILGMGGIVSYVGGDLPNGSEVMKIVVTSSSTTQNEIYTDYDLADMNGLFNVEINVSSFTNYDTLMVDVYFRSEATDESYEIDYSSLYIRA